MLPLPPKSGVRDIVQRIMRNKVTSILSSPEFILSLSKGEAKGVSKGALQSTDYIVTFQDSYPKLKPIPGLAPPAGDIGLG